MTAAGVDIYMFNQHSTHSALAKWLKNGTMTLLSSDPILPPHTGNSIKEESSIQDGDRSPFSGPGGGGKMVVTINTSWLKSQSGNSYGENAIVFPHSGIFLCYSSVSGRDNFSPLGN